MDEESTGRMVFCQELPAHAWTLTLTGKIKM
jgi:hypothetical protein